MSSAKLVNLNALKSKVTAEIFEEFCKEAGVCPECLAESLTVSRDDSREVVCARCGLVVGKQLQQPHNLPGVGNDTSYNDVCSLSFGKSLGSNLTKYQLYSVLSKSAAGRANLGIRAIKVRSATKVELSPIRRMLEVGSCLCKRYRLGGTDRKSVIFADALGKILRTTGMVALALSTRKTIGSSRLARGCFVYLFKQSFHDGAALQGELGVTDELLAWIDHIVRGYALPKGIEFGGRKKEDPTFWTYSADLPVLKLQPSKNKRELLKD